MLICWWYLFDWNFTRLKSSGCLLPEHTNHPYHLRSRTHSFKLSSQHDEHNFIDRMLFKNANTIAFFPVSIRNKSFTLTVNPICTCNFICNCMFELLYFNQFSSFIVQLRSVNCFLQNK